MIKQTKIASNVFFIYVSTYILMKFFVFLYIQLIY